MIIMMIVTRIHVVEEEEVRDPKKKLVEVLKDHILHQNNMIIRKIDHDIEGVIEEKEGRNQEMLRRNIPRDLVGEVVKEVGETEEEMMVKMKGMKALEVTGIVRINCLMNEIFVEFLPAKYQVCQDGTAETCDPTSL